MRYVLTPAIRIHAALIVSPRESAMKPKPVAPSAATAIQMTADSTLFICGNFTPVCLRHDCDDDDQRRDHKVSLLKRLLRDLGDLRALRCLRDLPSLRRGDLILLQLAVRHRERGQSQRPGAALDPE